MPCNNYCLKIFIVINVCERLKSVSVNMFDFCRGLSMLTINITFTLNALEFLANVGQVHVVMITINELRKHRL